MTNKVQQLKKEMLNHWIAMERARFQLGSLGRTNSDGTVTVDADRPDCVWVTLDTGNLIDAYNRGSGAVDKRAGLRVRVRMDSGRRIIDGLDPNGFSTGDSNAPGTVYSVNNVAPDSHGNVTLDSDDITEGSTNKYMTATSVAATIHAATGKTTPVDADELALIDSAASNVLKKLTWANLKATLKTYFDTLYDKTATIIAALTGKTTPIDADGFVISDSAASGAPKLVTGTNLKAYMKTYWDTIYAPIAKGVTNGDSHDHNGGDGAQIPTGGIVDAAVTLAKMADLAQATVIGRASAAGTGVPTALSVAQVVAIINSTLDHGTLAGLSDDDHTQYYNSTRGDARYAQLAAANTFTDNQTIVKDGSQGSFTVRSYRNSTVQSLIQMQGARGTLASPVVVQADDVVGQFIAYGYSAALGGNATLATMRFVVDGTPDSGGDTSDMPGRIEFATSPEGSSTPAIGLVVNSSQQVIAGGLTSAGASIFGGKAGTSSNDWAGGGVLYVQVGAVGQVGGGPDSLVNSGSGYSVPANTLAVLNQSIWWKATGTIATTATSGAIAIKFGATTLLTINASPVSGGQWWAEGTIYRTGAATQRAVSHGYCDQGSTEARAYGNVTPAETLSGAVVFDITGTSSSNANNDTVLYTLKIGWDDANV